MDKCLLNSGDWDADFAYTPDVSPRLPRHLPEAGAPQFRDAVDVTPPGSQNEPPARFMDTAQPQ